MRTQSSARCACSHDSGLLTTQQKRRVAYGTTYLTAWKLPGSVRLGRLVRWHKSAVDERTGTPLKWNSISSRIVKLAKPAGVKLSMHTLRKGCGCFYASCVSAQVLQNLMRHSNISVTVRYYTNVDQAVEEAVLGRNLPRSSEPSEATPAPSEPVIGPSGLPSIPSDQLERNS